MSKKVEKPNLWVGQLQLASSYKPTSAPKCCRAKDCDEAVVPGRLLCSGHAEKKLAQEKSRLAGVDGRARDRSRPVNTPTANSVKHYNGVGCI